MRFENINPYLRFVRSLKLDRCSAYPLNLPYDARFFYTKSGCGRIFADGTEYEMPQGNLLFIPSGTEYRLCTPEESVEYIAVNFDFFKKSSSKAVPVPPDVPELFNEKEIIEKVSFRDMDAFNGVLYLKDMLSLLPRLEELEKEYSRKLVWYESKISGIFTQILIECARKSSVYAVADANEAVGRILNYIHVNYKNTLTNADISDIFGFHPNHISSMIKSCTGLPLHRYLINVRLEHAVKLLEEGSLSVGEVAAECGFCDIYHFSKYFKSSFGKSPRAYRKKQSGSLRT